MVLHWAKANPFAFISSYLGHEFEFGRMSYPWGHFSFYRAHGIPLLPPLLSDKDRQQCQTYKQLAVDVEKRLQEKRLLKEKELESWRYEASQSEDENNSTAEMEVLEFIRKALGDSNDLEEVKFLISQVGEELKKRRSFGSIDSTFNDVDSFSLNQCSDPCNLDSVANYFDRHGEDESVIYDNHTDLQLVPKKFVTEHLVSQHNIPELAATVENPKVVPEAEEPVSLESSRNTSQLPFDEVISEHSENANQLSYDVVTSDSLGDATQLPLDKITSPLSKETSQLPLDQMSETSLIESIKLDLPNPYNDGVSPARSVETGAITPPRLIRSNSYTLDSPSPSVLMYLRSLALESASEKVEVSGKVIKNLNNYWKDEESKEISSLNGVSELENGVENVESNYTDNEESSYCTLIDNKVSVTKIPHELNGHSTQLINDASFSNNTDINNEVDKEKVKAAMIIQAAARGFLVRRLMKTQKIRDLKVIIKEAVLCAWNLYGEQAVSPADVQLHERIIQQVTAACYELHSIFFNWSTTDRMALIRSDREKLKYPKPKFRVSRNRRASESNSVSSSTRSKSNSSVSARSRSSTPRQLNRPTTLPTTLRKNVGHQAWSR